MQRRSSTIKDIARELGISVATVSRALRDTYDVSRETRERVLEVAKRLNYKPNLNALNLVQRHTRNIGVLIPTITNYYFSTVITGIQETANLHGYNIILYLTNDSAEMEERLLAELPFNHIDGLLVCVSSQTGIHDQFREINESGIPVVFFDRVSPQPGFSKVMQDDFNGAFLAVEHLVSCGYIRIAHITGPSNLLLTQNRIKGYTSALQQYGMLYNKVASSGFSRLDGESDTNTLFSEASETPDAIFAVNDRKAVGAILALKKNGIKVGKEVGVIGFTNDSMGEIISPTQSTIAEPAFEIGQSSCELIIDQLLSKNNQIKEILLPCHLIVRESTSRQ
ncbi:LacI family DNA-binding transcriptional regulator [Dyadobacter crusticola]|uniref:LacI family DNA-binding transcriptional regulator n=1 Tax=Dyadobacter crusticola TaxID=292407 RepID=UPI0004E13450|nr:LacI family DNA-binding transcriptional regulator [Dyadobacter crusticola]